MIVLLSAAERLDTWVFWVGIAIPVVSIAALVLWQLFAHVTGKLVKTRTPVRQSPEPPQTPARNDPESLERTCAALEESLARAYLVLAESWLRKGEPQRASAVLQRVIQRCPETNEARIARERLGQLGVSDDSP
jgi:hypothetical protein